MNEPSDDGLCICGHPEDEHAEGGCMWAWNELPATPIGCPCPVFTPRALPALLERFEAETGFMSSLTHMVKNDAFLEIVALGKRAAPRLLADMRERPTLLGPLALRRIFDDGPTIPHEDRGRVKKICEAWLRWANQRTHGKQEVTP